MGKLKFKNNQLKFKLTPKHIENGLIEGETKISVYGDFENEKFTVLSTEFSYDMKMFRAFLQKIEALKDSEEEVAEFFEKKKNLIIKISNNSKDNNLVNWDVLINKSISENDYTKLNIGFSTNKSLLDSAIKDISYFLVNPTSF